MRATFNARAESVIDKPMFRGAFIPASGFYERTGPKNQREPHLFTRADGAPVMGFAALWERWRDRASGDDAGFGAQWMVLRQEHQPNR